jgi:DNA-binding transcriptional LysR family regulator
MDLHWADLELILLLDRHGSLSSAARAAGVQQSTFTRRLSSIEGRLGQALFVRTSEGVVPTPLGESLLAPAYRAEVGVLEAQRELERQRGTHLAGEVRIATLSALADYFFAPLLHRFVQQYPDIRLHLVPDSRIADMTRLEADIAIRLVRPTSGDLVVKKLFESPASPHAAPAVAARLAELEPADWPWLSLSAGPQPNMFDARGIKPHVYFSSASTLIRAMQGGAGVGLIGREIAEQVGLVRLPRDGWNFPTTFWMVTHQDMRTAPLIEAVWRWIEDARPESGDPG